MQAMEQGAAYFMAKAPARPARCSSGCVRPSGTGETEEESPVALERLVTSIIHEVGVPAHIKGYQYVREAIILAVQDMDVINAVTKVLYPEVARRYNTTPFAWSAPCATPSRLRGTAAIWKRSSATSATRCQTPRASPPTPKFIAMIADRIRLQSKGQDRVKMKKTEPRLRLCFPYWAQRTLSRKLTRRGLSG